MGSARVFAVFFAVAAGCGSAPSANDGGAPDLAVISGPGVPSLARLFPSVDGGAPRFSGCVWASPLAVTSRGDHFVFVASADGTLAALDPPTGAIAWQLQIPAPTGQEPYLLPTPTIIGSTLFVAYALRDAVTKVRSSHHVAAVDLEARAFDATLPDVTLTASLPASDGSGPVVFNAATQVARSSLTSGRLDGQTLGYLYVSFGNIQDIQPWHGWVFELDLDAWRAKGPNAAIHATLLTTPESTCDTPGMSGSREESCGGGVWAPSGPVALPTASGFELLVPTGNGVLDLARGDYANTLMRVAPGLAFAPGCDTSACAGFDGLHPTDACVSSCDDLFIPRLLQSDPPLAPASGVCDGKSFFECYAALDWDLGANSPALIDALDALVLPGKDGAVYLIDRKHLGTLLDRRAIVDICGTKSDPCSADWAGMIVTKPVIATVDGAPLIIVPTFMFDNTHAAGVVALGIDQTPDGPRLTPRWQAPDFAGAEAHAQFRRHPGRATISVVDGEPYVWIVDWKGGPNGTGLFYGIRARDGAIAERAPLDGAGMRYVEPLLLDDKLYVSSCASDDGPSQIEGYSIVHHE